MDKSSLARTVAVTGAAGALGQAVARHFLDEGARVALIGIALGRALVATGFQAVAPLAAAPAWLTWLGRHSLAVYMVHQPVLLGALWVLFGR